MLPDTTATVMVVVLVVSVLILGGTISWLAYRAARRLRSRRMEVFTVGFLTLTAGIVVGGTVTVLVGIDAKEGFLLQGLLVLLGLGLLLRSLYAQVPRNPVHK